MGKGDTLSLYILYSLRVCNSIEWHTWQGSPVMRNVLHGMVDALSMRRCVSQAVLKIHYSLLSAARKNEALGLFMLTHGYGQ